MKIVFFATSLFAVPSLKAIAQSGHNISCVVTRPDKKAGRGMHIMPSPVKIEAGHMNMDVFEPENPNSKDSVRYLKSMNADVFVVISYGKILNKAVLDIPKKYCINLHGSLLPKYRGAAPCNWAVINGERKTGVSVIKLNEKLDTGDIITSQSIHISENDTSFDVYKQLSVIGAETLIATMALIEKNKESFTRQDDAAATYAPRLKKTDGLINWQKSAEQIRNVIRGTQPWPGAFTYLNGKILKIYSAEKKEFFQKNTPGEVLEVDKNSFYIGCADGALKIQQLQAEGKKAMSAEEFLRGATIKPGDKLGE